MQLFVQFQKTHVVQVNGEDTVAYIKDKIAHLEGLSDPDLAVYASGRPLDDDQLLEDCVQNLQHLEVNVRLCGGKVHGSLARAGKVKGQTPKVEPQEKKKKPTGRAKRREQYHRHFVNVQTGPGGKPMGPNANGGNQQGGNQHPNQN